MEYLFLLKNSMIGSAESAASNFLLPASMNIATIMTLTYAGVLKNGILMTYFLTTALSNDHRVPLPYFLQRILSGHLSHPLRKESSLCSFAPPIMSTESHPILPTSTQCDRGSFNPMPHNISSSESSSDKYLRGFIFMFLSALSQAIMGLYARIAETQYGYTVALVLIMRGIVSMTLSSISLIVTGQFSSFKKPPDVLLLLFFRGLSGALMVAFMYSAMSIIPIGVTMTLYYTSPILTSVASAFLYREPFTSLHAVNLIANFIGVVLVAGLFADVAASAPSLTGVLYALGSAAAATSNALLLRWLTNHGIPPLAATFVFGVGCLTLSLFIGGPNDMQSLSQRHKDGYFCVFISGVMGFFSQTLLAMGLRDAPAGPAVVVRSLNVPIAFALGIAVLGENISAPEIVGVLLVVGSVVVVGMAQVSDSR